MEMQSAQINELAKSLAAVQKALAPAPKNSTNTVGGGAKRKYADLTSVYETIREILPSHGLAVAQTLLPNNEGKAHVRTTLMHESGQWIAGECVMPCDRQGGPQGMGSAITYARRYSLSAMVGVVSEDDDDAEAAQGKGNQQAQNKAQPRQQTGQKAQGNPPAAQPPADPPDPNAMTPAQHKALMAYLSKRHGKDRDAYIGELSDFFQRPVNSSKELTKTEVSEFLDAVHNGGASDNPF